MKKIYQESVGAYDDEDVPYVVDKKPYTTNIAIEDDETTNGEIPDNSIIVPKKINKDKKLLIENPPKNKYSDNDNKITDMRGGDFVEDNDDTTNIDSDETEEASTPEAPPVSENIHSYRIYPDILGTLSMYLLQRKARKLRIDHILKDNVKIESLKESIKHAIETKIKSNPKNIVQEFIQSCLEKLTNNSKMNLYNVLMLLEKDDDQRDIEKNQIPEEDETAQQDILPTNNNGEAQQKYTKLDNPTSADVGATYSSGDHDVTEIGRIYELKRIFSRLMIIDDYLSSSADDKMINLRHNVSQAIDFFKLIISNIDEFLDKIDNIIIMYYDFLIAAYKIVKAYLEVRMEKS